MKTIIIHVLSIQIFIKQTKIIHIKLFGMTNSGSIFLLLYLYSDKVDVLICLKNWNTEDRKLSRALK